MTIYKITPAKLWNEAQARGRFTGSADDEADGFIHFSTAEQVAGTAAKHFAGQADLLLVAIDEDRLTTAHGEAFRYEPSRAGKLFPHLYADLQLDAVLWVEDLPLDAHGAHILPARLQP